MKKNISELVNKDLKAYSVYTLTSRGIPMLEDGLSNVQRIILKSVSENLQDTNTVIGNCIANGYHHGDSLGSAISRLARTSDNSEPLLFGDGFHGNSVGEASAPRYTKVKASPVVNSFIKKYNHLNSDQSYLHLDLPMGLLTTINGIATGYRSFLLPRKLEDLKVYVIEGKKSKMNPHFKDFKGVMEKTENGSWKISSVVNESASELHVFDMSPIMTSYESVCKNLDAYLLKNKINMKIKNLSKSTLEMIFPLKSLNSIERTKFVKFIKQLLTVTVKEDLNFIYGDKLVSYDSIFDYLDDFKIIRNSTVLKNMEFELSLANFELGYNESKIKYLESLMSRDLKTISREEIQSIILEFKDVYRTRLKNIAAHQINKDELRQSKDLVKNFTSDIKKQNTSITDFIKHNKLILDPKQQLNISVC